MSDFGLHTVRELTTRESVSTELPLTDLEAATLAQIGRSLSGQKPWWGDDREGHTDRSVVQLQRLDAGRWLVTFREVVGVVHLGSAQLQILPKIAVPHFNYLIQHSELAPRTSSQAVAVEGGDALASLVAKWFLSAAERLLRQGLRVDYREERDELDAVRGRLDVLATATACQSGRPVAICEFPELDEDTTLNRVVKAAIQLITSFSGFPSDMRSRARRVSLRMANVGPLRSSDRLARVDRVNQQYAKVLPLAKLVLDGGGIQTRLGSCSGSAFLLRTPELVEDGLRSLLVRALPHLHIKKQRRFLGDSGLSLNPDLVFLDGIAVADVKYRLLHNDWQSASLYQAVAFATGFRSRRSAVIGFSSTSSARLPRGVQVGEVEVRAMRWNADPATDPADSKARLIRDVLEWAAPLLPT